MDARKEKTTQNIAWKVLEALVLSATSLGHFSLVTSAIAPSQLGVYSLGLTVLFFVQALSLQFALQTIGTRDLTQGRSRPEVFTNIFILQLLWATALAFICLPLLYIFPVALECRTELLILVGSYLGLLPFLSATILLLANFAIRTISLIHMVSYVTHLCLIYYLTSDSKVPVGDLLLAQIIMAAIQALGVWTLSFNLRSLDLSTLSMRNIGRTL